MGWLSKIFKGSSHNVSEGRYDWNERYEDTVGNEPSSSEDAESENEDINHAIALSLLEEDQNRNNINDNESQLKEDEKLAKALHESLYAESPIRDGDGGGNIYQPIPFPHSSGFRICAGCNTEIGYGRFLNCMGSIWHPECFRCRACNQPICDYEFSMYGNSPYHKSCYKESYHPKCDVCKQFIPTNPAGLIEYRAHPFWVQRYCPLHEHDETPRCCSCERMESKETKFVALNDGRKLCLECLDSAIMDTNKCQPLYLDIQEFYERLGMKVEQQVPLLLVERQALNEAMDGEKSVRAITTCPRLEDSAFLRNKLSALYGFIVSLLFLSFPFRFIEFIMINSSLFVSYHETDQILRRPIIGAGNMVMGMITEPYKLTRHCEVTAILILYGLPRLLTGSILAHEMMHAYLRLKGYQTLSQDVEEGICQVLAHMWLVSQLMPISGSNVASTSSSSSVSTSSEQGTESPFERKLGEFFKYQIESDISPVYGNGFRAGNHAVLKYGLWGTLDHIRWTGCFPY